MNIRKETIVSNSEMIKNYKHCREKAEGFGKIFVIKRNKIDAVLFSITEYERLSVYLEYVESLGEEEFAKLSESLIEGRKVTPPPVDR